MLRALLSSRGVALCDIPDEADVWWIEERYPVLSSLRVLKTSTATRIVPPLRTFVRKDDMTFVEQEI